MKIKQDPHFEPITIRLETRDEAETFWGMVLAGEKGAQQESSSRVRKMSIELSDWFTNFFH